jgi:Protein NO VEIN, C-terminal
VSKEDGDGLGYDIASFAPDGRPRLIEVKTTNGWERTPFQITRNELAAAEENRAEWCLFRLWSFSRKPKAFELYPPLDAHVSLTATMFQASFC